MLNALISEDELTINELLPEIEKKRALLETLGMKKGLGDPGVIFLSQQPDKLLNQYYWLSRL